MMRATQYQLAVRFGKPLSQLAVRFGKPLSLLSAVSLPLPTGAATESTLSALSAKFSALGQTTMSASVPVVLASNHSDIVTKKSASSYAHLNSTGTTTIKSGAGILRRVVNQYKRQRV